jgi:crotonobetainyl-CoA:carnitine CoA-transferase CaiB-like acyl-CoA transferase
MLLADQGADVIKVEPTGSGDFVRRFAPHRHGMPAIFVSTNRNKRSLALNLKDARGMRLLLRLLRGADVFVQNFRPGVAERMGLGHTALHATFPDLVYVSISGFGERGPYANQRVFDPIIQALSGLADIQADADSGRPRLVRTIVPDKLTGLTAAQAITAALLARQRTGKGQHVRLAMLDAMVAFLWPEGMAQHTFLDAPDPGARDERSRDLIFETADGYITVAVVSDDDWRGLARALEHPEWLNDSRFATPAGRERHADDRLQMTAEVLRLRPSGEWLSSLQAQAVPCAPVLRRDDVIVDPQIAANEMIVNSEHPHLGRLRQARPAARFARTPTEIRRPAPLLGEHSDEVLGEIGIDAAALADLRAAGVIG